MRNKFSYRLFCKLSLALTIPLTSCSNPATLKSERHAAQSGSAAALQESDKSEYDEYSVIANDTKTSLGLVDPPKVKMVTLKPSGAEWCFGGERDANGLINLKTDSSAPNDKSTKLMIHKLAILQSQCQLELRKIVLNLQGEDREYNAVGEGNERLDLINNQPSDSIILEHRGKSAKLTLLKTLMNLPEKQSPEIMLELIGESTGKFITRTISQIGFGCANKPKNVFVGPDEWLKNFAKVPQRLKRQIQDGYNFVDFAVAGKACPDIAYEDITVLFIFDVSGSMSENDPACYRKLGASTLSQKINADIDDESSVYYKYLTFSNSASMAYDVPNGNFDLFSSSICSINNMTNFQAAFNQAKRALENVTGRKIVYFLSDGLPTMSDTTYYYGFGGFGGYGGYGGHGTYGRSNDHHMATARSAAASLMSLKDLTLFGVLLGGDRDGKANFDSIIGDSNRTRQVQRAEDLSTAFLDFPKPSLTGKYSAVLQPFTVNGVAKGASKALNIKPKVGDKCWDDDEQNGVTVREMWCVDYFPLTGQEGSVVNNKLTVRAETILNGQIGWTESIFNIMYRKQ
jgi:hypothetical protein